MKKFSKRVLPVVMACLMLVTSAVPAFAATPVDQTSPTTIATHPSDTMSPTKTVYPIGTKSFYKVDGTVVSYADQDDGTGYVAIPSAFIFGSEYNTDGKEYGMYVTNDGAVHFVDMSLCHEDGGVYTWYHGTADGATVSSDVDKATNQDNTMGTDFYINIEKDAIDPDGIPEESVVIAGTNDDRVEYEITVSTTATYQLDVTVPMYVCMFGYGGDGNIIEPTSDVYQLLNYSTSNSDTSAEIVDITKITHYTRIYDENHSNENLYAIAFNTTTGAYQYWYSMPTVTLAPEWVYYVIPEDLAINASGECYVIYIDGEWSFKAAGVLSGDALRETINAIEVDHALAEDFLYGPDDQWNFGTTPAVGDKQEGGTVNGMPVMVSGIQAQPHTWKLVGVDTSASEMARGELTMSIAPERASSNASAIDLSTASAKLDITERGWHLDAPATDADGNVTAPADLGLIVNAKMAGGSVNDAGCTSVVTVNYTVIPQMAGKSVQTNTSVESSVNSNYNQK